ncbi:MAG: right-handed parallel beta-helix repeat-containing protein [Phycisphaerae bacterium]|nr:right-handed parallel beta-helix repeat-containing protein [Phycisphaerae bacterium]
MAAKTYLNTALTVLAFLVVLGASTTAGGQIIYVDDDADGANDGSSWTDAFNFLQDALATAYYGDEIRVAQGTYKPDQGAGITPGDREATFQLINGVTLKGGYAGFGEPDPGARDTDAYETILTGAGNSYHVVTGSRTDETAVLDGFTVTGGNANAKWPEKDDSGSGMFNHNGSPRLANCTFKGNKAYYGAGIYNVSSIRPPMLTNCIISDNWAYNYGGGIYNKNCSPILTNCTFSDNKASDGAGMYNMSNRSMLSNCAFINNWASEGGGMYNRHDGNPTLTNCTFSGNSANIYGGGMANRHSSPTMTNCIFSENSADAGGGIRNLDSNPTLTNCAFAGNSADSGGGGMYNRFSNATLRNCIFSGNSAYEGGGMFCTFSSPTLINCTLSGNSASDYGGGIYGEDSSNPTLTNCTLWGNSDSEIESSAVITYSDIKGGWPGKGNIDADPYFVETGYWDANGTPDDISDDFWVDGDYHLLLSSPCIDTGDPNYIPEPNETDLDGKPRVIGGRIDMGAYEYSPPIQADIRIIPRTINLRSKGQWIAVFLRLPEEYDVSDVDPNSIFLENEIRPDRFWLTEEGDVAIAKFSREDVQAILDIGDVELTITGRLTDGAVFEGTDTIKVIDKAGKN